MDEIFKDLAAVKLTNRVLRLSHVSVFRSGQSLFNSLPEEICNLVSGSTWDPFYKDLKPDEIYRWIEDHLIFDGEEIVGLYNKNTMLYQKER